jgi:chromatin segregation and condensation protein Rec8/ScpA/Scc1 (kleisin family)
LVALDKNNKYDQAGQQNYSEISGKYLELKSAGLVKPEQEKEFIAKQEQWQKEKKTYDEMVAREKALQEAEQKKAAEEAKKAAASAPKSESKPKGK